MRLPLFVLATAFTVALSLLPNLAIAEGPGGTPPQPSCGLPCESPLKITLTAPSTSVMAGQPFSVAYSIKNLRPAQINGQVNFTFEGQAATDPQHPAGLTLNLAPNATITGKVQVNLPTMPGGDLSAFAHTPMTPCGTNGLKQRPRLCFSSLGTATLFIPIGADLGILGTLSTNPPYDTSDPTWAKKVCGGNTFMSGSSPKFEWTPVLDPDQAAESRFVALAGQVIAQQISSVDLWFTHPFSTQAIDAKSTPDHVGFGGDWNLDVAWSSNPNFDYLVAPPMIGNDTDTNDRNTAAAATGLLNPKAMHIEAEAQFIPEAYRAAIRNNVADKVVIFGRWIVDCGHGVYQTEIHPPLLFAAAHIDGDSTVSTVIGRPFLVDQTFSGDGLYDFAIKQIGEEAAKSLAPPFPGALIIGDQLHAETAVETKPFTGLQWMIYYVRPPVPAQTGQVLSVTYHFKVHSGVVVQLFDTRDGNGTIGVSVLFNDLLFNPNPLPPKVGWTVSLDAIKGYDDLDVSLNGAMFGSVAIGNPAMAGLIDKGVKTEWYGLPPIVEAPDETDLASNLPANTTTFLDDTQPYPITGGLSVHWINVKKPPRGHKNP